MHTRFLALIVAMAAVVVGFAEQQQPTSVSPGRKARMNDTPTPGRLGGVRRDPLPRLEVDVTGFQRTVPDSWQIDPVTGAQFRRVKYWCGSGSA